MSASPELNGSLPVSLSRIQRYGRNALALAGATVSLLAFQAVEGSATADGLPASAPKIAKASVDISEAAPAPLAVLPRAEPFQLGITTYNSLTDGTPDFFADEQFLGLNSARESITRSRWRADLDQIQADGALAAAHGIDSLAVVLGDETSASRIGFSSWAARIVAQLPPQVNRVIIENEVNSQDFYDPPATDTPALKNDPQRLVKEYTDELAQTYTAIKAVDPDIEVCGFGLDSIEDNDPVGFLQDAAAYAVSEGSSLQADEDCVSDHEYLSPEKDEAKIATIETVTAQPIYIDEFGRNLNNGLSLEQQATETAEFLVHEENDPQVQGVDIYHDFDPPADSLVDGFQTGLRSPEGILLPDGYAVQNLAPVLTK